MRLPRSGSNDPDKTENTHTVHRLTLVMQGSTSQTKRYLSILCIENYKDLTILNPRKEEYCIWKQVAILCTFERS